MLLRSALNYQVHDKLYWLVTQNRYNSLEAFKDNAINKIERSIEIFEELMQKIDF